MNAGHGDCRGLLQNTWMFVPYSLSTDTHIFLNDFDGVRGSSFEPASRQPFLIRLNQSADRPQAFLMPWRS